MIMKRIISIIMIGLLYFSCNDYSDKNVHSSKNNNDITIDKFTPLPFKISKSPSIDLPDSLGGKNFRGKIVVTVDIDSMGNVVNYEIISFVTPKIQYFGSKKNIPIELQKFNNWINEYISQVVFTKNDSVKLNKINKINIPIKIGAD